MIHDFVNRDIATSNLMSSNSNSCGPSNTFFHFVSVTYVRCNMARISPSRTSIFRRRSRVSVLTGLNKFERGHLIYKPDTFLFMPAGTDSLPGR